jgi:hypothetical protein
MAKKTPKVIPERRDADAEALALVRLGLDRLEELARKPDPADAADPLESARCLYDDRRRREKALPRALFGEPCWDMLLTLFIARLEGRVLKSGEVCRAAGVPEATGLSWLRRMEQAGLITRRVCKTQRQATLVDLTRATAKTMTKLLSEG